jgi:hypothetical protein
MIFLKFGLGKVKEFFFYLVEGGELFSEIVIFSVFADQIIDHTIPALEVELNGGRIFGFGIEFVNFAVHHGEVVDFVFYFLF